MKKPIVIKYLANCFLLLIPVLVWNVAFRHLLPDAFAFSNYWDDLPTFIYWGEIIFRIPIYILPLFMLLQVYHKRQKIGLALYIIGLFLYFLSWRPLILYPGSDWSMSLIGFIAPSITPIFILTGIGMIGSKLFIDISYRRLIYLTAASGLIFFNTWHSYIVYTRVIN